MADKYFDRQWEEVRGEINKDVERLKQEGIDPGCWSIRATDLLNLLWICLQLRHCGRWYFRGQSDSRWGIGIQHRIAELDLNDAMNELADGRLEELILQFKKRCMEFRRPQYVGEDSEWRWEFYAQHQRLVTRLLDWTTNPLVATYFAVTDYPFAKYIKPISDDSNSFAAVWALSVESERFKR